MNYIGIDIGSSFMKAGLLNTAAGTIEQVVKRPTPDRLPNEELGVFELDAELIVRQLRELIDHFLQQNESVAGVWLSTQMHGFVLCDAEGELLTPYVSWRDTRAMHATGPAGHSSFEMLSSVISEEQLARGGTRLKPGLAAGNVHHWLRTNADVTPASQRILFCTLGGYVIYRLTGRHVCHMTNASPTGFADLASGGWNRDTIRLAGCDRLVFPEIVSEREICGVYDSEYGGVPLYPDIGDHQASVLGAVQGAEHCAVISGGTAGIVSLVSPSFSFGEHENRPYFGSRYLKTITQLPGGRNLDVLVEFIDQIGRTVYGVERSRGEIWHEIFQAMSVGEPANTAGDLRVELGFFPGQRGVRRGAIDGIQSGNFTVGSLFRAAFAGMAEVYCTALEQLMLAGEPVSRIVLTGGSLKEQHWVREWIEQRTGVETTISTVDHEELNGLLLLAASISGKRSE